MKKDTLWANVIKVFPKRYQKFHLFFTPFDYFHFCLTLGMVWSCKLTVCHNVWLISQRKLKRIVKEKLYESSHFSVILVWILLTFACGWKLESFNIEFPTFNLREKIWRRRFEKLSKNCQNFLSAKLLSSRVFSTSYYITRMFFLPQK